MKKNTYEYISLHNNRSPLQRITCSWAYPLIEASRKQVLSTEDLGPIPAWLETRHTSENFYKYWQQAKKSGKSWTWIISKMFIRDISKNIVASLISDIFLWIQAPLLEAFVRTLRRYQSDPTFPPVNLYLIAGTMFLVFVIRLICNLYCAGKTSDISFITRAAIMGSLYRKSLAFSSGPHQKYSSGNGINIVTADTNRICTTIQMMNFIWLIPLRIVTGFAFAYWYMGVYSLPGIAFIMLVIAALYWMAKVLKKLRNSLASSSDARLGFTKAILQNLKTVKFLALDEYVESELQKERDNELDVTFKINTILAISGAIDFWAPIFSTSLSISIFAYYSTRLDEAVIGAFIQALSGLIMPLWALPSLVGGLISAKVATRRIDKMLQAEEIPDFRALKCAEDKHCIIAEHAKFQWDAPPSDVQKKQNNELPHLTTSVEKKSLFMLDGIDLLIPKGSLVAVVGKTGSGKSSLISALLGEMKLKVGKRVVKGSVGLCQQYIWLTDGTIRDNILFGSEYDDKRYRTVIKQCNLDQDLNELPNGDLTLIGDKRTTLSGGQRQRIGLARVAYAKPDIALLDDPLSSVDPSVGRSLFYGCIKNGLLKDSTRVLTTQYTGYLSQCDLIILMESGRIIAMGTYMELSQSESPKVKDLLFRRIVRQDNSDISADIIEQEVAAYPSSAQLKYTESAARNASRRAFRTYFSLFGGAAAFLLLTVNAFAAEVVNYARQWLLQKRLNEMLESQQIFSLLYVGFGTLQCVFSISLSVLAVWFCNRASKRIHNQSLSNLLSVQLPVLDSTPIGRIVNRFGRDLELLDIIFPDRITSLIIRSAAFVSAFLPVAYYWPKILLTLIFPFLASLWLQNYFRRAWRQLQEISGISLGPVLSHFSETLTGLSTIRSFNKEENYIKHFDEHNDRYCYAAIWLMSVRRWASLRFQAIWVIYLSLLIILCIVAKVPPLLTQLTLCFVINSIELIEWFMRQFAEMESCFISVERIHKYTSKLPKEADSSDLIPLDFDNWPSEASVQFEDVTVQYKPDSLPILKNLTFSIKPLQKVAIVGRSGAGKSTIASSLFRFMHLAKGKILIDNVDISRIPLKMLRKKIAMVSQDSFLFTGTLRSNLDPNNQLSDERIWNVLDTVGMKDIISDDSNKLDLVIDDHVSSFSNGQRQLLCLARAILRNCKIIILDEALSNLDKDSESLMQESLDEALKGMTVIRIAHKVEMILGYDLILVIEKGRIVECGAPKELAFKGSYFTAMLNAANVDIEGCPYFK